MSVYKCAALFAAFVMVVAGNPTDTNFLTDEVNALTDRVQRPGIDLLPARLLSYKSAFTAKLTTTALDLSGGKLVVFDSVLTNVGNDYNPKDGRFTTSIPGTYVFSLTLMSRNSASSIAYGCLEKNDVQQICVWSNGSNAHEMSSNTITLNLKEGDVVDVVSRGNKYYGVHNYRQNGYCSFSGFLLYPEESLLEQILDAIRVPSK